MNRVACPPTRALLEPNAQCLRAHHHPMRCARVTMGVLPPSGVSHSTSSLDASSLESRERPRPGAIGVMSQRQRSLLRFRTHDETRAAIAYLRRHQRAAESIAPSLYARKKAGRYLRQDWFRRFRSSGEGENSGAKRGALLERERPLEISPSRSTAVGEQQP